MCIHASHYKPIHPFPSPVPHMVTFFCHSLLLPLNTALSECPATPLSSHKSRHSSTHHPRLLFACSDCPPFCPFLSLSPLVPVSSRCSYDCSGPDSHCDPSLLASSSELSTTTPRNQQAFLTLAIPIPSCILLIWYEADERGVKKDPEVGCEGHLGSCT